MLAALLTNIDEKYPRIRAGRGGLAPHEPEEEPDFLDLPEPEELPVEETIEEWSDDDSIQSVIDEINRIFRVRGREVDDEEALQLILIALEKEDARSRVERKRKAAARRLSDASGISGDIDRLAENVLEALDEFRKRFT